MDSIIKWHTPDVLPPPEKEGGADSVPVIVTHDGKSISALGMYLYEFHGRREGWVRIDDEGLISMDTPMYWARLDITENDKSNRRDKVQLIEEQDLKELFSWWFSALDDEGIDPWRDEECVAMANKYQYTTQDYQDFLRTLS